MVQKITITLEVNRRDYALVYDRGLCLKVGRGLGDGDAGTRVRGRGTRGREMWDAGT